MREAIDITIEDVKLTHETKKVVYPYVKDEIKMFWSISDSDGDNITMTDNDSIYAENDVH